MDIFLAGIMADTYLEYERTQDIENIDGTIAQVTTKIYEQGDYTIEERTTVELANEFTEVITMVFLRDMLHCEYGPAHQQVITYMNKDGKQVTRSNEEFYIKGKSQALHEYKDGDENIWQ